MRKEGDPEYINGKKTGLVWSEKYQDFIYPNLDQIKIIQITMMTITMFKMIKTTKP